MNIYVDMDGVLADFVSGYCGYWNFRNPHLYSENIGKDFLLPPRSFGVDCEKFWVDLHPTLECFKIIEAVKEIAPCFKICTTPYSIDTESCRRGKMKWLRNHFPHEDWTDRVIFSKNKSDFATEDTLLIDDFSKNVDKFREAGGNAILVPRLWNRLWKEDTMETVLNKLKELTSVYA